MKLIKINRPQVSEDKEVPGLLSCRIEYQIKTAQGRLRYTGPMFDTEMWHQVMSFFRWTHKEMQSESQVRLYVNPKLRRWGAWAFPQKARTGMTAQELPEPETPEKARERFASWRSEPSDDWLYFGTAHHHCAANAFQSSTDEQNERNQDGLHLTVGTMDAERHDVHARLYLGGHGFEPDLSQFWPIDARLAGMVPGTMLHELARFQMGERVTLDFPEAWRANLVAVPTEDRPPWALERSREMEPTEWNLSLGVRADEALEEIHARCAASAVSEEQWMEELHALSANDLRQIIIKTCVKHSVTPDDLLTEMSQGQFNY